MSRIGKLPVPVPSGVDVTVEESTVTVKGPKGVLSHSVAAPITVDRGEGVLEGLAHLALSRLLDLPGGDVALLLEDVGHARLELAVRHRHRVVVRLVGVAQTREHVCDRVSHRHVFTCFLPWFPEGPSAFSEELPGALGDAGQLAGVRHLPEADPAQAELAEHRLGAPAALAPGVTPDRELRLACCLDLEGCLGHLSCLP
jgi:hypothetical protein